MADVAAVGAIAVRDGDLLLVKRGHPPSQGLWSLPGGHVEPGETHADAVRREVKEETGLDVEVDHLAGEVRWPGVDNRTLRIRDFHVTVIGGELRAADDAADVAWVPINRLTEYELTKDLLTTLQRWSVLPS